MNEDIDELQELSRPLLQIEAEVVDSEEVVARSFGFERVRIGEGIGIE